MTESNISVLVISQATYVAIALSDQENTGTFIKRKLAFYLFLIFPQKIWIQKHALCLTQLEQGHKSKILDGYPWEKTQFPFVTLIFKCPRKTRITLIKLNI